MRLRRSRNAMPSVQCRRPAGASAGLCCDDRQHWVAALSRRKGEITAAMNERDLPHIVELPLPSGGFRSQSDDMLTFHRARGIEPRRGLGWHNDDEYYVRYCFADPAHADAFRHPSSAKVRPSVLNSGSIGREFGLRCVGEGYNAQKLIQISRNPRAIIFLLTSKSRCLVNFYRTADAEVLLSH